jgi:hypothetical protein
LDLHYYLRIMIPKNITEEHIIQAIRKIDAEGIRNALNASRKYDLLFEGKKYPPKHVIAIANEFANGSYLEHTQFVSNEARSYLRKFGDRFPVVEKEDDAIAVLIKAYKRHVEETGMEAEQYKWRLVEQFRGRPDLNAEDFGREFLSIDYNNLIYPKGLGVIRHIAGEYPEDYRNCFKILFDEERPLDDRLKEFFDSTLAIYRRLVPDEHLKHHHDERAMATFLSYKDPLKYTLYMDSFYRPLCRLVNEEQRKPLEKYAHYIDIVNHVIREYISEDNELITLVKSKLPPGYFEDPNHLLLAQDIFYQMLKKLPEQESIIGLITADSTGWQEEHIRKSENSEANIVWNSARPVGTEETLSALRGILDDGETFSFYYSYGGNVHYRATVVDFATPSDYNEKKWDKQFRAIYGYEEDFGNYADENKSAAIVFLVKKLERIIPVSVSKFKTIGNRNALRQQNVIPISSEPSIIALPGLSLAEEQSPPYRDDEAGKPPRIHPLNQILYGPPGTGKTYSTVEKALEILGIDTAQLSREDIKKSFELRQREGQIAFITFHQSLGYEDFIEGIKPKVNERAQVIYDVQDGLFKTISERARINYESSKQHRRERLEFEEAFERLKEDVKDNSETKFPLKTPGYEFTISGFSETSIRFKKASGGSSHTLSIKTLRELYNGRRIDFNAGVGIYYPGILAKLESYQPASAPISSLKNYVLIIDEINRGNVSQIFGELITLLEEDKRLGEEERIEVKLPYSGDSFGVPPNLYIIGTMNTADRSVEALDTALRRRFQFFQLAPDPSLVPDDLLDGVDVRLLFETINRRLEILKDKDHQIGHAWFNGIRSIDDLKKTFANKILPLLQEFFYNDTLKLGLVLGKSFFDDGVKIEKEDLADFEAPQLKSQYMKRDLFRLKDAALLSAEDFQAIYAKQLTTQPQ